MKTGIGTLAVLLLVGLFATGCATTAGRLDAEPLGVEYEEEMVIFDDEALDEEYLFEESLDAEYEEETVISSEEEELEKAERERERTDWDEFIGNGDSD